VREPIIKFDEVDIQALSLKHFGDLLTKKEIEDLKAICSPRSWSQVDDGGWEGTTAHLLQAVLSVIQVVRMDRRGNETSD
jgi:NAD(P)H-flavin reductase